MKEYSHCPICNNSNFSFFKECKDYTASNDSFSIVQCTNCQFTFTNPIPIESEIGKYYDSENYVSHSNTSKGITNKLYQIIRNYTLRKKVKLLQSLNPNNKLLDIGCGTGEFLNQSKINGFDVLGIEPSEKARTQAKNNFHLEVKEESAIEKLGDQTFDFITMWHVLEHVYPLNERVQQMHRLLKDNGQIIIAVPNRESYDAHYYDKYWAAYDVPRHLYHFTPNTIAQLFENHGFTTHKVIPMKFDSFYVSMLSEKYKNKRSNLVSAFFHGLQSNLKSKNQNKYSSQIYVFTKK